jgi:hypothetical protein
MPFSLPGEVGMGHAPPRPPFLREVHVHLPAPRLHRAPPERFVRHRDRDAGHDDVERRADVDRHGRRRVRVRRDDRGHDPHHAVARDRDAVPRRAVRGREDLGRVRVQRAVVDVEREVDCAAEAEVLPLRAHLRVPMCDSMREYMRRVKR